MINLLPLLLVAAPQQAPDAQAFLTEMTGAVDPRGLRAEVLESRVVLPDSHGLRAAFAAGAPVELELFRGVTATLTGAQLGAGYGASESRGESAGPWTARGGLAGDPLGEFSFAGRGRSVTGNVRTGRGELFTLRMIGDGLAAVRRVDAARYPKCGVTEAGPATLPESGAGGPPAGAKSLAVVNVLVTYSDVAAAAAGGHEAMLANIDLMVADMNEGLAKSITFTCITLAGVMPIEYAENGSFDDHLGRLTGPVDGFMDQVHAWRTVVGADLVALLVDDQDQCGKAWVLFGPVPQPFLGFSVTNWDCAVSQYSFAHELGHNMGGGHDLATGDSGAFADSHGWQWTGDSGAQWRSIMAYEPGTRVPRYSHPGILWDGKPTGASGLAHNANTIHERSDWVADYSGITSQFSPVYVDFNVLPAAVQNGSFAFPYDSLEEGLLQVESGGVVKLRAGTETDAHAYLGKPCRIELENPFGPPIRLED